MVELSDLLFYKTGAMSFQDRGISPRVLTEILASATSCAWLGRWRMIAVTNKDKRVRAVEKWQEALKKIEKPKEAEFIERWKQAPLFVAFYQPKRFEPFTWVPSENARTYSLQEVGTAVRSIELKALEHGIGLHGIMGLLFPEIGGGVSGVLGVPEDQELVFFGIMGYPDEVVDQQFPKLEEVCYFETWKGK